MPQANQLPQVARFGVFEADLRARELRKHGLRIRLQDQPFQVLAILLEHPGEIVTREELQKRVWPADTFVDFDHGLNKAINKIREALGDSAENPRFVETIARRGYRFLASVDWGGQAAAAVPSISEAGRSGSNLPIRDEPARWSFAKRLRLILPLAAALLLLGFVALRFIHPPAVAFDFRRLSYGKGPIRSARFTSDGHSMVYGAAWSGNSSQLFWTQPETPESRSYPLPDADILAVSPAGEMAVLLNRRAGVGWISHGTLAVMPLTGGAPREVLDDVQDADWDHDGKNLGIVHWVGNHCRLEFPIGTVLFETAGGRWLSDIRISPGNDLIAFMDHPLEGDDAGSIAVIDLTGHRRDLTSSWVSLHGLAWDPSADSVWFSGNEVDTGRERPRAIYRLKLNGDIREVVHESGDITVHDVSLDRRLLVTRDLMRFEILGRFPGVSRDLSWLDFSRGDDLSPDGGTILMTVEGEAAGRNYQVYLRKTDGSPPVQLGEGYACAISPDGKWILAVAPFGTKSNPTSQFILLPAGKGEPKDLTHDAMSHLSGAWFPDGARIVFRGSEPGRPVRSWILDLAGGAPQPITPEGTSGTELSPDGNLLVAVDTDGHLSIYPVAGGQASEVRGVEPGELPVRWHQDGKSLFVSRSDRLPVKVYRVELASGRRDFVQDLAPGDPAGVFPDISSVFATPDGRSFLYSYFRQQSDLYVVTSK
jgi:DNA-binding winged helix-turn-helix (wHTH) protein